MSDGFSDDGYIYLAYSPAIDVADNLRNLTGAVERTMSDMNADLSPLVNTWVGTDKDEYDKKQQKWNSAVDSMQVLLASYSTLLNDIISHYGNHERNLAQGWSEVRA